MAVRREDTLSELQDIPIGYSWIPATPAKPDSTKQQPICTNWQESNVAEANWLELETHTPSANLVTQANLSGPGGFLQEAQCHILPACYSSTNVIDVSRGSSASWQAGIATDSPVYGDMMYNFDRWQQCEGSNSRVNGDVDKWPTMSFGNLLALAHAGCNKGVVENALGHTDFMANSSIPQVESSQFTMSFANSSMQHLDNLLGAKYQSECNTPNVLLADGSSIPPRPTFDLNSQPRTLPNAALGNISSQFEPITPEKTNKAAVKNLSADEAGKDARENVITRDGTMELQEKENSQLVTDELQLQENHKPDKGGTEEETDLSKTPQQKPRRRKHRPKVIIEGQKSTPKSSAKRPSVPQDSTREKRKYVKRKVVDNNPTEGGSNETDLDKNAAPDSVEKETPTGTGKRKYVRKKGVNKPEENNMEMATPEKTEVKPPHRVTRTCRRSLNFNSDGQVGDESSSCYPSSNCEKELQAEKNESTNMDFLKDDNQIVCTRGKCQIVFSDVTHDKEANTVRVPYGHRSPIDSICSSTCLTPERQARGLKRQNTSMTVEAELSNRNEIGSFYNSMQAYLPVLSQDAAINNGASSFHFPAIICKKKRTEKGHNMATSTSQYAASTSNNHAKLERQDLRDSCTKMFSLTTNQNGRQVFEDLLALGPPERIKKRRSKGPTRLRNLASLLEICKELPGSACRAGIKSRIDQDIEILHENSTTCMEALVADTRSTLKTKKRSKRSMLINSTMQNLNNNQTSASMGVPLALTWKSMSPIDTIIEQLNRLDLNAESSQTAAHYQEQNALVPYQRWGAVVPYDNSFDQVRRRKPRPKVELDDETTRVWKLLLENINSEGIDGTDEEKTKWWEEERRVFNGRADSFIARMHLVQGDRRFSPWKGSVLDSVVGVFLTQNVSDHLSSSAFMAMVARFPPKSKIQSDEEKLGNNKEPDVCELDTDLELNKEILNQSVCGEEAKMLHNSEDDSTREVNSVKPSGSSSVELIRNDNLNGRDTDDTFSSQTLEVSSQNSADSPAAQTTERSDSCLLSTSEEEQKAGLKPNRITSSTSFVKLLQMAGTVLHGVYENKECDGKIPDDNQQVQSESTSKSTVCHVANSGAQATEFDLSQTNCKFFASPNEKEICAAEISGLSSESAIQFTFQRQTTAVSVDEGPKLSSPNAHSTNNDQTDINQIGQVPAKSLLQENNYKMQEVSRIPTCQQNLMDVTGSNCNIDNSRNSDHKEVNSNKNLPDNDPRKMVNGPKAKGGRTRKEKEPPIDWDQLRKQANASGKERVRTANTMDSVDWEAVRCTDVNEIAQTIKERGMNNMLAERIKDFLNRLIRDHGSIDLEWLRDVPPDKAKEYLLSIRGLGLKSVECVRLLTLHHLAFPVDTNVGRIAVRLGWVPLQPLPESLQLHLLELYPVLESIQKYLWPRLCKLDQRTLYELHYQMITFGKVFCTKSKPNCYACPMRGECRHFASAFASARLSLPAPEEKSIISATGNRTADQNPIRNMNTLQLPSSQANQLDVKSGISNSQPIIEEPPSPETIVVDPASPEPGYTQVQECDIENAFGEDPDEIPTIQLNMEEFTHNLQKIMKQNTELQDGAMSKALVALTSEAASLPVPKLKNISRLRTEHQVYELPDSHPLLEGMDKREPDDPCPYLLAIWTPGETVDSIEPPERRCSTEGFGNLCNDETCSACNSVREANSQTVRGTLLIPCRTAMRGSFPLNGTYFQVNEVFSDHESSLAPMDVPRQWLWNLPRRTVYFGTSIPTIFKGLSTEGIQYCFWRGFVCVRGFDRKTRAPRPLIARLHFPASRLAKGKGKLDEN